MNKLSGGKKMSLTKEMAERMKIKEKYYTIRFSGWKVQVRNSELRSPYKLIRVIDFYLLCNKGYFLVPEQIWSKILLWMRSSKYDAALCCTVFWMENTSWRSFAWDLVSMSIGPKAKTPITSRPPVNILDTYQNKPNMLFIFKNFWRIISGILFLNCRVGGRVGGRGGMEMKERYGV